jgi:hypothetical protein
MTRVHEYIRVLAGGTHEVIRSNGPIGLSQSRQEVGGAIELWDPGLGDGYAAQVNEDRNPVKLAVNVVFEGVLGNVLIGRSHGNDLWGLTAPQKEHVLTQLKLVGRAG